MTFAGRFSPRTDLLTKLENGGITSTADFLLPHEKNLIKEQPLWIFIAGPTLNSTHQLLLLVENVQSFEGKQVENSTYNRVFRPRVIQDYDLKESDVPAFLFVASSSRVTIPHLLFRVDTPSWPVIKGVTESLPLQDQPNDDDSALKPTTLQLRDSDDTATQKNNPKTKKTKTI